MRAVELLGSELVEFPRSRTVELFSSALMELPSLRVDEVTSSEFDSVVSTLGRWIGKGSEASRLFKKS